MVDNIQTWGSLKVKHLKGRVFTVVSFLHLYHKSISVDVDFLCFSSCLCPQKIHPIDSVRQDISKNVHFCFRKEERFFIFRFVAGVANTLPKHL